MTQLIFILLLALPVVGALMAWLGKGDCTRRLNIMVAFSALHFVLSLLVLGVTKRQFGVLGLDSFATGVLLLTSGLFFLVTLHIRFWHSAELAAGESTEHPEDLLDIRIFTACLQGFLAAMTLVILSEHLGLMWVAVEATTLVSAPLILFHRSQRSVEALWKYLLICSVGIGLALLGTMFLGVAAGNVPMTFRALKAVSAQLHPGWFKAAFVLVLVGYGTKMGLAPFHSWLPDAHSEAPGVVSALLSAALLNCSFLAIYRFLNLAPASVSGFCHHALVILGLLSLLVAVVFMIGQNDYKRMLAYSSVEHMGLIAIIAGMGLYQELLLLHMVGHSLIKMTLFLLAGNFLLAYGTRTISRLGGMFQRVPRNAFLFMAGIIMICGMPPACIFLTELKLIQMVSRSLALILVVLLFMIFAAMTYNTMKLMMGKEGEVRPEKKNADAAERLVIVPCIALSLTLLPLIYIALKAFPFR